MKDQNKRFSDFCFDLFLKGGLSLLIKLNNEPFDVEKHQLMMLPIFEEILDYLLTHQNQEVTLREIKRNISETTNMDHLIDEMIKDGFVSRYHGRYEYAGNFISADEQENLINQVHRFLENIEINSLKEELNNKPAEERYLSVLHQLFKNGTSSDLTVYETTENAKRWLKLPTRYTEVTGKKATFFSFGTYQPYYSNNLSDYFNYLKLNHNDLPDEFLSIRKRIGDVNPSYFINYCERKLRRLEKGKEAAVNKADIFMETLYEMDYLKVEQEKYLFNLTRLPLNFELPSLVGLRDKLKNKLQDISCDEKEVDFMISCLVLEWLVDQNLIHDFKKYHGVL